MAWRKRERGRYLGRSLLPAVLICGLFGHTASGAGAGESLEYEVKAAMIYNFTRFVEWPATAWKDARSPMVIGVLGEDPFGLELDQIMRDKTYGGRPIQVRRLHSMTEIEGCHVLFVSKSEKKSIPEILRRSQAANVLTVSDVDEFAQMGGAIGFVLVDKRIRFEINPPGSGRSSVTISSKLLRLALKSDHHGGSN